MLVRDILLITCANCIHLTQHCIIHLLNWQKTTLAEKKSTVCWFIKLNWFTPESNENQMDKSKAEAAIPPLLAAINYYRTTECVVQSHTTTLKAVSYKIILIIT